MLLRHLFRFVFRLLPSRDPWERWELGLDVKLFGSSEYFRAYSLRESSVAVGSLDEICEWLLGCEYHNHAGQRSEQTSGRLLRISREAGAAIVKIMRSGRGES